jgi:CheY-like chemotaxis protein
MDVHIKDVDGVEATRPLRERPDAPPVLVLTTFDDDEVLSGAAGRRRRLRAQGRSRRRAHPVSAYRRGGEAWLDPAVTERVLATYRSA